MLISIDYKVRKEVNQMTFAEIILIALFCMAIVFSVLGILWGIIRVFSSVIKVIENKREKLSKV